MGEVTRLISAIDRGEPRAAEQLLPLVYDELRKLAANRLAQERPGQTLQATALVHEAYLRLVGSAGSAEPELRVDTASAALERSRRAGGTYNSRGHFFAAAAEAMRRILIDQARRKGRDKRGGGMRRVELNGVDLPTEAPCDVLVIDEAVQKLAAEDPRAAELVKLQYFAGLTLTEAAEVLGISRTTAYHDWAYARAWLRCELDERADQATE
jgi:RNA polymerase sigma factor (TIGR02999 family)